MFRKTLHSKIHMASVTAALPEYHGSITIDGALLEATGLRVSDAVTVANVRTGARFDTYVFRAERGSGRIEVNGPAARLVEVGDRLVILHFAYMNEAEYAAHRPTVLLMNADNSIEKIIRYEPG